MGRFELGNTKKFISSANYTGKIAQGFRHVLLVANMGSACGLSALPGVVAEHNPEVNPEHQQKTKKKKEFYFS